MDNQLNPIVKSLKHSSTLRCHVTNHQNLALHVNSCSSLDSWIVATYWSKHVFDKYHELHELFHGPQNTKQLPAGYFVIFTMGVGYHLNHQMRISVIKKGTSMGNPSGSVGAYALTQGLCSETCRARLTILISNPGFTKASREGKNGENALQHMVKG